MKNNNGFFQKMYINAMCLIKMFILHLQRRHVVWEGGRGGAQPGQGDQPEVHREEDRDRMESGNTVDQDIDRYNASYIYRERTSAYKIIFPICTKV